MLKKHGEFFRTAMLLGDLVTTTGAFALAFWLRFEALPSLAEPLGLDALRLMEFPDPGGAPRLERATDHLRAYALFWLAALPVCAAAYAQAGLYQPRRAGRWTGEAWGILRASFTALVVLLAAAFFIREGRYSRLVILLFAGLNPFLLGLSHLAVRQVLRAMRRRDLNVRHALVVGSGRLAQRFAHKVRENRWTGIRIRGFVDDRPERAGRVIAGRWPVLGGVADLPRLIRAEGVEQVYVCLGEARAGDLPRVLGALGEEMVDLVVVPDFTHLVGLRMGLSDFDGLPLVTLQESPLYGWRRFVKRAMDIVAAALMLLLTAPLFLLIALLIKALSPGPVFYRQERMGWGGRTFTIYKFRTMRADAETTTGPVWASAGDPRRHPFGAFLRKTSLDEFPQFYNVLKGDMSIVGPRPERPVFIEQFSKRIPRYMLRHTMKAGITGWAQVRGWRGNTSLKKRIQYDLYYIEHWSLWFDLKIMFLTLFAGFVNRNAY
ncbi:MAG: undecaprenyl-phosphate glucose phosphotransferase [Planctomycetes bacterium]|nr:undecaprenyl-phosphate glucose phosphotransferase [Planctomycetota bacterium]